MSDNYVANVMNQALDAAAVDLMVGDPEEGTRQAQVALRAYPQCLRQLLRAVHWDFARQVGALTILADATGQTVGAGTQVIAPWIYEYSYPVNCMKARFLPANWLNPNGPPAGNIALPTTPQTTVSQPPNGPGMRLVPAPFLISMDTNYPIDANSNWMETQGTSPTARVVILTNVQQAQLVFTAFMPYPSMWDAQFRAAFVSYLASEIALPLTKDKKFGLQMRNENIKIAKEKIQEARVTNGNEGSYPQTTDHTPDFLRIRNRGAGWSAGGPGGAWGQGGVGVFGYGFDSCMFGDGSIY